VRRVTKTRVKLGLAVTLAALAIIFGFGTFASVGEHCHKSGGTLAGFLGCTRAPEWAGFLLAFLFGGV
jgi:hypothetical protein